MYRDEFHSSARDNLRPIGRHRRRVGFAAGGLVLSLVAAAPAAAAEFNCFKWVAATAGHVIHPHHHHTHAARAVGVRAVARPHPRRIRPIATRYVRHPVACPVHEVAALASPVPGVPAAAMAPQTGPEVLATLAGPPPTVADAARQAAALAPEAPAPTDFGFPGGFPGGTPPDDSPFTLLPPGVPVTPPIISPPITSPPVTTTPTPPVDVFPPIVPPVSPPGTFFPPPPGGPGPGPAGGVPEPASWALMVLGLGAAGAALRRRMASLRA